MTYWTQSPFWYDNPNGYVRSEIDRALPPVAGRTVDSDYEYKPLSTQELRDAAGLGTSTGYDNRLERLQVTGIEQAAAYLNQPPVPVERSDGYVRLGRLMWLSAYASRADDDKPRVYYRDDDFDQEREVAAASVVLVGPRLVAIDEEVGVWSDQARIVYRTDLGEGQHSIREFIYQWVGYQYRKTAGETVSMPDPEELLGPWVINRVAAG